MKRIIFALTILFIFANLFSQDGENAISIQKKRYYQNETRLSNKQLYSLLTENPASADNAQTAKTNGAIGTTFIMGGTICLLVGAATSLNATIQESKDLQNGHLPGTYNYGFGWLGAAGGLILISIPFSLKSRKFLNKSVEQYNSSLSSSRQIPVEFELMTNATGIGIRMRF